jgi:queuine tRNA-ribosyltransferase
MFERLAQDRQSKAQYGRLTTTHGVIDTPAFMSAGTQGSVKAVSLRELHELDAQIVNESSYWAAMAWRGLALPEQIRG